MMSMQTGEVAKLAKVSIRTLHHYHEIGLLVPSGRSDAGYRLYSHADLQRLQQILFYRMLEFSLEEIQCLMNAPDFDRHAALLQQRELIRAKAAQLGDLLGLIDRTLAETTTTGATRMDTKAMFEVFPEMQQEHIDEAQQRWGDSAAWQQSAQRSKHYTKQDWENMKEEMGAAHARLEEILTAGLPPASAEAIAAVDALRLVIHKWQCDCSRQFHAQMTAMTSNDERFIRNIDRNCPGLAAFIHEAALANLASEG